MKIIDTHSHIYLEEFDADREDVISRAKEKSVSKIILPAIDLKSLDWLISLCRQYPDYCFPLLGLHPEEVREDYREILSYMNSLLETEGHPFVGIGEVGLDFYWDQTFREEQLAAFEQQIEWAIKYQLPLIIHARAAQKELVSTLYKYKGEPLKGIFHCFCGTAEDCEELLSFQDFCLGIGGVLTFKKSKLPAVIENVPLERLVVETDCPYLAPVPHRGQRNESSFVYDTVMKLAQVKGVDAETVARITTANAERLFF